MSLPALWAMLVSACLITYDPDSVELDLAVGQPSIALTSPTQDQEVGATLEIRLQVDNFELVARFGEQHVDGEGHIHLFIDDSAVGDPMGVAQAQIDIDVDVLANAEPRPHSLRVVVHRNDHNAYPGLELEPVRWIKLPRGEEPVAASKAEEGASR